MQTIVRIRNEALRTIWVRDAAQEAARIPGMKIARGGTVDVSLAIPRALSAAEFASQHLNITRNGAPGIWLWDGRRGPTDQILQSENGQWSANADGARGADKGDGYRYMVVRENGITLEHVPTEVEIVFVMREDHGVPSNGYDAEAPQLPFPAEVQAVEFHCPGDWWWFRIRHETPAGDVASHVFDEDELEPVGAPYAGRDVRGKWYGERASETRLNYAERVKATVYFRPV